MQGSKVDLYWPIKQAGSGAKKMNSTRKRHWVTTLLAVWMFADATLMLLWTMYLLYGL